MTCDYDELIAFIERKREQALCDSADRDGRSIMTKKLFIEQAEKYSAIAQILLDSKWVSVEDELPPTGRKVLATYHNNLDMPRIIVAEYVRRYEVESDVDSEDNYEYSEEHDEYYLIKGWYEQQDNWGEFAMIYVNEGAVTHWMPLPKPPKQSGGE